MTDRNRDETTPLPTLARLEEMRQRRWHQTGEALLTLENLRSWINAAGLVLFAPRPQIVAPAPSLVEAVLGARNAAPTLAQTAEAQSLLGRLVAEGIAVPLNLLGAPSGAVGETPDFVAAAGVFPYLFTLRGDKAWKQPPATSGAAKVSPLAANAFEALGRLGSRSAYDLATELGSGVTESAVLRALGELWTHLRVLPLPQPDGRPTLWELASTRFTKQMKAGANAGQPSALSALITLYLGQAAAATEDEIASFLSPVAARSRIRDVVHALTAARQLDTFAVEGRTMLHVAGDAPALVAQPEAGAETHEAIEVAPLGEAEEASGQASDAAPDATTEQAGDQARIKKFVPKPRKVGTGYLAKGAPVKRAGKEFSSRPAKSFGAKPFRAPKEGGFEGRPDRERRPFAKDRVTGDGGEKRFDKPWNEKSPARTSPEGGSRPARGDSDGRPTRPRSAGAEGGWKPAFRPGAKRPMRTGFGDRAPGGSGERRDDRGARPARFDARGDRPMRRPRSDAGDERAARPPRSGAGGDRPFRKPQGEGRSERPFRRPDTEGRTERPFRRFDAPRFSADRTETKRPYKPRPAAGAGGEERPRREFRPRAGTPERSGRAAGPGGFERRPGGFNRSGTAGAGAPRPGGFKRPGGGGAGAGRPGGFAGKRPGGSREGGFSAGPKGPGAFAKRPGGFAKGPGGFAGKPGGFAKGPGGFAGKPGGFAKKPGGFAKKSFGGKSSFGERPAKRTFKRKDDQSA